MASLNASRACAIAFLEGGIAWLLLLLERFHASHETHFQHIPDGEFGLREEQDPAKQSNSSSKTAASTSASRPKS